MFFFVHNAYYNYISRFYSNGNPKRVKLFDSSPRSQEGYEVNRLNIFLNVKGTVAYFKPCGNEIFEFAQITMCRGARMFQANLQTGFEPVATRVIATLLSTAPRSSLGHCAQRPLPFSSTDFHARAIALSICT